MSARTKLLEFMDKEGLLKIFPKFPDMCQDFTKREYFACLNYLKHIKKNEPESWKNYLDSNKDGLLGMALAMVSGFARDNP